MKLNAIEGVDVNLLFLKVTDIFTGKE